MHRLRIWSGQERNAASVLFADTDGRMVRVTNWRLFCTLLVGRYGARREAVIDTGAPTTVFPLSFWPTFATEIEWLPFADGSKTKPATLGGDIYHYKFGKVSVRLAAREGQEPFPPVQVIAQFEHPHADIPPARRLTRTLVGLQFGPLEGLFLVTGPRAAHAERVEAWITDARPVDPLVLTSATL